VREPHPIKEFLLATRHLWDHPATPINVRDNFSKILACGTIELGAEVYISGTEMKLVYHTCKSKFCTSCGQRSTEAWQRDLEAILPDIPYRGITLTMPCELWPILQQNRHLLSGMSAMGAEAIQQWVKARYGARVLLIAVPHTFGGFLNFYPHLHVLVSAGGLQDSQVRWQPLLRYGKRACIELMQSWRYAMIAYLAEALRAKVIQSELPSEDLRTLLELQYTRKWHIHISHGMSKRHFLHYVGRYVRRAPVAQHRLERVTDQEVEYLAKDTRNQNRLSRVRFSNQKFLVLLKEQVPSRGAHAMRYFGLLAPRTKACTWAAIFIMLGQKRRPHPPRIGWRRLRSVTFGIDPLVDSCGKVMHRVGWLAPSLVAP
jgi:hypothetical protein